MTTATTSAEWTAALADLEADWATWVCSIFADQLTAPFAHHHVAFWDHCWSIQRGVRTQPFVWVVNRNGAKSSSMEMAVAALGATGRRRYCWYVSRTQESADTHVENIASLLEAPSVADFYPQMSERRLGKFGNARGWRRSRLWTASGFVVDAVGLDKATRGVKVEDARPDLIVWDDIDDDFDTPAATNKIVRLLTKKIQQAGSTDACVLAGQNLVHENSVFAQLADGRADFLHDRILVGPVPAVDGLQVELVDGRYTIIDGEATWAGFDLDACQAKIDEVGLSAFLSEGQHDTEPPSGGLTDHIDFDALRVPFEQVPALVSVATWLDPAVTDTDQSDSMGIQIDGLGIDSVVYRLWSWERRASPLLALKTAIRQAITYGGTRVGVETDQGGETWGSVFREARDALAAEVEAELLAAAERHDQAAIDRLARELDAVRAMRFVSDKAGAGHGPKQARFMRMIAAYERPGFPIRHVIGTHTTLERALRRFPRKPLDLADAMYWSHYELTAGAAGTGTAADYLASASSWRR